MIEVNLLPGGKKRGAGKGPSFSLSSISMPDIGGLPEDRWVLGSGAVVALVVIATGYLYWSLSGQVSEVEAAVEEAVADSARYADLIQQAEQLRARRDSIAQRVEIIQEIDQERYVWPHIMDEVARALPEYTWLTGLVQTSLGQELQLRITGMAGNNFALTTFMENLEASPFIRGVTLVNTQLTVQSADGVSRSVNEFTLEAAYEDPPLEMLETVPLFESGPPALDTAGAEGPDAASDTAGASSDTAGSPPDTAGSGGSGSSPTGT